MNILSVDDIVVIRKMICKAAEHLDAYVFEAGNGEEALQVLQKTQGKIDLIFLDWNMPKMSGIEFLTLIKKHPKYKDIPVVMTTTVNERENIIKAIQAGASQYMVKPFTQEDIIKKIMERIDVSASLRYLFLIKSKELIAEITGSEVEEKDSSGIAADKSSELYAQMVISGQQRIIFIYTMSRESLGSLIGWNSQKKAADFDDKTLLGEFNKFLRQVAKACLSQTQGYGYSVPFIYSSFVTEKNSHLAESGISVKAKLYSVKDIKMTLTSFLI